MAQIPGYKTRFEREKLSQLLADGRYVHFLGGDTFAPLDARLFQLRQKCGTQSVPTLVIASLLSKKLAVGLKHVGLDIRVSSEGNFGRTWDEAHANAGLFQQAAQLVGIASTAILTEGQYPYQPYIGRREALFALSSIFSDSASPWLREHQELCRTIALACSPVSRRENVARVSTDMLAESFYQNLDDQGGTSRAFEEVVRDAGLEPTVTLFAANSGFVTFDLAGIRQVFVREQVRAGSEKEPFPDPIGLVLLRKPSEWVKKGEPLASIRCRNAADTDTERLLTTHICQTRTTPISSGLEAIS